MTEIDEPEPFPSSDQTQIVLSSYKPSSWRCYLFGNRPGGMGFIWEPMDGCVPNRFVRFFMRLFFDCYWERTDR